MINIFRPEWMPPSAATAACLAEVISSMRGGYVHVGNALKTYEAMRLSEISLPVVLLLERRHCYCLWLAAWTVDVNPRKLACPAVVFDALQAHGGIPVSSDFSLVRSPNADPDPRTPLSGITPLACDDGDFFKLVERRVHFQHGFYWHDEYVGYWPLSAWLGQMNDHGPTYRGLLI